MKKTKLSARLLASMLAVVFCAWGGITSCSDGSDVSVPGQENVSGGGEQGSGPSSSTENGNAQQKPSAGTVTNAEVKIVKSEGLPNSAYVIFEQIDGAAYEVTVDGTKIDEQLIRYYDEYVWYEPNEAADLSVTWKKDSYSKVVRADALGLTAGEHTIKVAVKGSEKYSTATMKVLDHDRSGFAFTGAKTPGAYNKDGTLKSGAVVIYLTQENKKTVTATIGGKPYTGIQDITQAIKTKNTNGTAVDIRIVGMVKAENNDLSCADHKSSYALGVKDASEVTIEGVGHDATLYGAGVAAFKCDYIEIANLGLMKWGGGKDGDGIALKGGGAGYIWVHNNDVFYGDAGSDGDQVKGDGSMDLKDDTKYVTIAYNHFWDSGKMSLCGMKSESGPNYITYHHNWFDHSDSRHPRIRTMTVHVYNNYFDGNAKYGVGVTTGASCFVEGNYFRNAHNPMMSSKQGTDAQGSGTFSGEKGGVIKSWNNAFDQKNTNGVKFQFITNKYDYTNNRALGEYKEEEKTLGEPSADGWVIYDSAITSSDDTIATNSLIAVEDASVKGAYYQTSKGKTCFFIDVPKNTTKIVIKAKTGSSTSGATTGIAIKDESEKTIASVSNIGNTAYEDFSFAVSGLTADSTLEIANTGSNSLNISGIKVIAETGWKTIVTSGADPTNIDAYEVTERSQKVPDSVKTRSGGTTYSNFDTVMGNAGLGLSADPTGPKAAKTDVLNFSGRHNSDFAHNFSNVTDDASYAKNDALNNALVSYKTGFKGIQGTTQGGTTDGDGDGDDKEEEEKPPVTGSAVVALVAGGTVSPTDSRVTCTSCSVNTKDTNGAVTITYAGTSYTTVKMESGSTITVKATAGATITVIGSLPSGKQNCFKVNNNTVKLDAKTTESTTTFQKSFTATGNDVIAKGDTASIGLIVITEAE
ncbi:MAG: hypothetical protein K2N31_10690 [Treponemataceae bacterium]|nr:hypothetical protein [Treponemataceae bacterium]